MAAMPEASARGVKSPVPEGSSGTEEAAKQLKHARAEAYGRQSSSDSHRSKDSSTGSKSSKEKKVEKSPFRKLIKDLCDEHDREVLSLKKKVEDLDREAASLRIHVACSGKEVARGTDYMFSAEDFASEGQDEDELDMPMVCRRSVASRNSKGSQRSRSASGDSHNLPKALQEEGARSKDSETEEVAKKTKEAWQPRDSCGAMRRGKQGKTEDSEDEDDDDADDDGGGDDVALMTTAKMISQDMPPVPDPLSTTGVASAPAAPAPRLGSQCSDEGSDDDVHDLSTNLSPASSSVPEVMQAQMSTESEHMFAESGSVETTQIENISSDDEGFFQDDADQRPQVTPNRLSVEGPRSSLRAMFGKLSDGYFGRNSSKGSGQSSAQGSKKGSVGTECSLQSITPEPGLAEEPESALERKKKSRISRPKKLSEKIFGPLGGPKRLIHGATTDCSNIDTSDAPAAPKARTRKISWADNGDGEDDDEQKAFKKDFKVRQAWNTEVAPEPAGSSSEGTLQTCSSFSAANRLCTRDLTALGVDTVQLKKKRHQSTRMQPDENGLEEFEENLEDSVKDCFLDKYVISPVHPYTFGWDITSLFFIAYDCVIIPFDAFSPDDHEVTNALGLTAACFWALDIPRNLITGFTKNGNLVHKWRSIFRNYASTWLMLDVSVAFVDWLYLIAKHFPDTGLINPANARAMRVIRIPRLLRFAKVARVIKAVEDRITSEPRAIMFSVVSPFVGLILLNHVVACMWFAIGVATKEAQLKNWITTYLSGSEGLGYEYATSYHWALTQFTPASIAVQPENVWERFFGVVVLLFALLSVSSFVSSITNAVMLLRSLGSMKSKQFWLLRRYLRESAVPPGLSLRIQRYCEFAWQTQQTKLREKNVSVLNLLSPGLMTDLHTAIHEPTLSSHPLIVLFSKLDHECVRRICSTATTLNVCVRGSGIFRPGEEASSCYLIASGECRYFQEDEGGTGLRHLQILRQQKWVCECVLWTAWKFIGTLVTRKDSDILLLDAQKFADAVLFDKTVHHEAEAYARGFVQGINRLSAHRRTDLWQSTLNEGLWFRLLSEYNHKRCTEFRGSQVSSLPSHEAFDARSGSRDVIAE